MFESFGSQVKSTLREAEQDGLLPISETLITATVKAAMMDDQNKTRTHDRTL
jgi:hypothetical protein